MKTDLTPVQDEIFNLESKLIDFTKNNSLSFLSMKRVFSKNLSTLDLLYFKVDELLKTYSSKEHKDIICILMIYYMLLILVIRNNDQFKSEIKDDQLEELNEFTNHKAHELIEHVISKNRKYGNSALNPIRIMSSANKLEQLYIRLDDKFNRLINRQDDEDEDLPFDIAGYFILIYIHFKLEMNK